MAYRAYDGNIADDVTHIPAWVELVTLVGTRSFLYGLGAATRDGAQSELALQDQRVRGSDRITIPSTLGLPIRLIYGQLVPPYGVVPKGLAAPAVPMSR